MYIELGKGTKFSLYLPTVKGHVLSSKSCDDRDTMPQGKETVLLVDDEDAVRNLARHVLQSCGYTVLEASDGREATRVAEGHGEAIDLLVSDVMMPHMGGWQLAERLATVKPGMKLLFMSGYTNDTLARISHQLNERK